MTKLQKAIGAIILLSGATIGIAAVGMSSTIGALETSLKSSYESNLSAHESYLKANAACRDAEIAVAKAKLEMQGAAKLPVDQIEKLQKKAKGENLEVCPLN